MKSNLALVPDRELSIDHQLEEYLDHCRARGLSPATIQQSYGYAMYKVFLPWLRASHPDITTVSQLTTKLLDEFTAHLLVYKKRDGKPLSRASASSYARNLNIFLNWASPEAYTARAQKIKSQKTIVHTLTREEIQQLEDAAPSSRDKLIIRLLADTGMRTGGLVSIRTGGLEKNGKVHQILVTEKGGKERYVTVAPKLWSRLDTYIRKERPANHSTDQLFLALRREGGEYCPLTEKGVLLLVKGAAARAGITKRTYPHLLRHSYITHMVLKGVGPEIIAAQVGHESMTLIHAVYLHLKRTDHFEALLKALEG